MNYRVSRVGTALVTLHEGTDTTACAEATNQVTASLESLADDGAIADREVLDAEVYEHPTAPFDPYTLAVTFRITVLVEADDESAATAQGESTIDRALEAASLESVTYTAPATARAV